MKGDDMSEGKSDFIERMKKAFESGNLNLPEDRFNIGNWLGAALHPQDRYVIGIDPAAPDGDFTGIQVYTSDHIKPGEVYMVSARHGRVDIPPEAEAKVRAQFERAIEKMMWAATFRGQFQWKHLQPTEPYHHHRFPNESLIQWGQRLQARGLLDDPAIRWEYQKAVLGAPWAAAKRLFDRFRG